MLVGAYITPRNFDLTKVTVKIPNLPDSFNGYKIIQISDIHLGSWNNRYKKFNRVIQLTNRQNADIIVFTGDMVNNYAEETAGWSPFFLQLEAKNAKFAIKGNHDYGDYTDWDTFDKRNNNNLRINQSFENFKFKLLLNEHVYLKKGTDSICLVGVENFGGKRTSNYSDLQKALQNTYPNDIKILLSHDPNHFDAEISKHKDIVLTLAGHTHAAQMGIKIGDWLLSPAAFVFKYSAGLYKSENQYIYVNRGLGYIGLPLQIGVRPEITLIELIK
jgi:predicted MPP superfamily phosphohydrolase